MAVLSVTALTETRAPRPQLARNEHRATTDFGCYWVRYCWAHIGNVRRVRLSRVDSRQRMPPFAKSAELRPGGCRRGSPWPLRLGAFVGH